MKRILSVLIVGLFAFCSGDVEAQWNRVAEGIEYREFHLDGPINAFVARADRGKQNWVIDTCIGMGSLRSGRETVTQLAERYNDSVNVLGERYDVKVAINGDYFSFKTDQPSSGLVCSGWLVNRFLEFSGGSGFVWTFDRRAFLGGNVRNGAKFQKVTFSGSGEMRIERINGPRGSGELVLYTPQYADSTHTSNDGAEVLVQLERPLGMASKPEAVEGTIVGVRRNAGATPLAFDRVVLSGDGPSAEALLGRAAAGGKVRFELGLKDYGVDAMQERDWRKVRAGLGGHFYCVVHGKVPAEKWESKGKPGAVNKHPRTCVAFDDDFVYFVVVDGRSERSLGMTITELGHFCADQLSAAYAIAQDGGGSSAMWLNGKIVNKPSDGQERPVADGYLMALIGDDKRSDALRPGRSVIVKDETRLRLGPGTNYALADGVDRGDSAIVLEHRLNGVYAKKTFWWNCGVGDAEGWLSENVIVTSRPGQ